MAYDLTLPETEIPVRLLGKTYVIDITDFKGLTAIQGLPCMASLAPPTDTLMDMYIGEMREVLSGLLGGAVEFEDMPGQRLYFFMRSVLVQVYNLIAEKQAEYLSIEYPLTKNMLEIAQSLAKANGKTDDA